MAFDTIRNYYEQRVIDRIMESVATPGADPDYLADLACVALNHLPPRYMRHDVDMVFYLSPQERQEIDRRINDAVQHAVDYIAKAGRS